MNTAFSSVSSGMGGNIGRPLSVFNEPDALGQFLCLWPGMKEGVSVRDFSSGHGL